MALSGSLPQIDLGVVQGVTQGGLHSGAQQVNPEFRVGSNFRIIPEQFDHLSTCSRGEKKEDEKRVRERESGRENGRKEKEGKSQEKGEEDRRDGERKGLSPELE
ncbi:hypothetical protein TNCV_881341 [Trichonephila clavipes]|nr:hypothetical protein TNCV_881341 [Trichonephila clavipes]